MMRGFRSGWSRKFRDTKLKNENENEITYIIQEFSIAVPVFSFFLEDVFIILIQIY